MHYIRTFHIQAAHFNSERAYQAAWEFAAQEEVAPLEIVHALTDVHGHNFKIVVTLKGTLNGKPWLVDDVALAGVVMEWDNTNLSMHPDFLDEHCRATTERMAETLLDKLRVAFGDGVERVVVHETDCIFAVAE